MTTDSSPHLVKIEFQRVQTFLFAVPRLADIVGANALLGEALRYELPQWAKQCECSVPPNSHYQHLPDIAPPDDPLTKISEQPKEDKTIRDFPRQQWEQGILARDGGHFQVYFADSEKAKNFIQTAQRNLRDTLPNLRFSIELKAVADLEKKLALPLVSNANNLFNLPFLQQCQEAGNGVAVDTLERDGKERAFGLTAEKCKDKWQDFKAGKTYDIAAIIGRQLHLAKANTFDELCGDDYLALIHADGNGLGKAMKQVLTHCKKENVTGLAKEAHIEAFFHTMRFTLRCALAEAISDLYKDSLCKIYHNQKVRLEGLQILMLGGDDLLVACRAPLALPLVECLAQKLNEIQKDTPKEKRLTIGVGVAIAKPSFPFHRLHDLAEELASSAKRLVREVETPFSVVDWAICSEAWHGDVSEVRKASQRVQYTVNGQPETLALSAKPYRILGKDSLQTLLQQADELKKINSDTARSQLREIVRIMRKGRRQADFYYDNLEIASPTTWQALQDAKLGNSLWQAIEQEPTCYKSQFIDLVEIIEIERLKTEKSRDKKGATRMKRYQLSVTLLEDLHTGSGTGAGDYDALLARDRDGKPMIPASHLLGVWKYNLERSKLYSEQEINALFGASNGQRGALIATGLYSSKDIDSLAWTSTTRVEFSRVAQDNTLRTKEFIPAGSVFNATLWLRDETLDDALNKANRLTDCLGARRQRGDGRIKTGLTPESSPDLSIKKIDKCSIRLLLRAADPLCLPITGSPDNIIESECYLRGQVLRGALIGWLLQQNAIETAQHFFDDRVQVSNAYPVPCREKKDWKNWQVLPMPLHFATPKPKGAKEEALPWWASSSAATQWHNQFVKNDEPHGEKLKRPSDNSFIFSPDGQNWQSFNVTLSERLRNSPPSKNNVVGSLFAQQEITEQTLFLAELVFADSNIANAVLENLQTLLQNGDCLTIGRGGAPLVIEGCRAFLPTSKPPTDSDTLTITLTSDLIARSPTLGFYDKLTPTVLLELLNLEITDFENWQSDYSGDYVEVYGFNVTTGLPRLPALAIRRGSSLQIKGNGVDTLRAALDENSPLGERTQEGFGQFRLDFLPEIKGKVATEPEATENSDEKMYALAEKTFKELPNEKDCFPALAQWQALRFHENNKTSLVELIEKHRGLLQAKKDQYDASNIAWLKKFHNKETQKETEWLDWLINQLKDISEDKQQRVFYRALLSKVRLKLRDKVEATND